MGDLFDNIGDFVSSIFSLRHMPFFAMMGVLGVLGVYFSTKLWTKERAARPGKWRLFWRVGRDTQPLHPMLTGALWMLIWGDPMGYHYGPADSLGYGAFAGALSLFVWVGARVYAKRKWGINLSLPGSSMPPVAMDPIEEFAEKFDDLDPEAMEDE